MELELFNAFMAGVFAGGLLLGFGFVLGKVSGYGIMHKRVDDVPYDPDDEPMNEEFFEGQWGSDIPKEVIDTMATDEEFPLDEILQELYRLHRHSEV